jgi:DNA-binding HxlR family transcriptional regulator
VGSSGSTEYCAFTKAVEHLGDRWSLLIVRELAQFGPQGFNTLAAGLPGRISRSVLADRLRRLEELGLIARDPSVGTGLGPYCLTPAGEQLVPTLMSFWAWARHWVPEDPATARRDPALILWWLRHRIRVDTVPERQVVLELAIGSGDSESRSWLLIARGSEPELCLEDPELSDDRYVYVEADADDLYRVARESLSWLDALAEGSIRIYGDPELVAALPGWFAGLETGASQLRGLRRGTTSAASADGSSAHTVDPPGVPIAVD